MSCEEAMTDRMQRMLLAAVSFARATDVAHSKDATPGMREGAQGDMDRAVAAFEEAFTEAVQSLAEDLVWKSEDKLREELKP
jgi:hypothetical protein